MWINLLNAFTLSLQNLKTPVKGLVIIQVFLAALHTVVVDPLKEQNIILEFPLTHLLEGCWLCDFEFFYCAFNYPQISETVIGISGAQVNS
jgi:hypothetical protein